jgi:hypothetical protein
LIKVFSYYWETYLVWLNIDLARQSGKAGNPPMSDMQSENEVVETGGKVRERGQGVVPI